MIKADNIVNKEFRKSLFGYDREDVDKYLDELIEQLRAMEKERREMASTIEYLVSELTSQGAENPAEKRAVGPISPYAAVGAEERKRTQESGKRTK